MRPDSIFRTFSLDRTESDWAEYAHVLTPVEQLQGVYFKREDYFAPLGYGGINGAKLRQCIWLTGRARAAGFTRVVSGASVKSPQLSMGAAVSTHFGMKPTMVIGSSRMETALRHENVALASMFGADFALARIAYNPALQKAARERAASTNSYLLQYGITTDGPPDAVEAFHRLGAQQVQSIPDDVDTLYLPAGSCNSCVSVLYGLALFPRPLRRVVLFGIGPTRLDFIDARLRTIEQVSGVQVRSMFDRVFHHHPEVQLAQNAAAGRGPTRLEHFDLHATKFADYQDEMPFRFGGVDFHPTYEGKVMTYMQKHEAAFADFWKSGRALFWIVGSRPSRGPMMPFLKGRLEGLQ